MKLFKNLNAFDRMMAAISFAEGNEDQTAVAILESGKRRRKSLRVKKTPEQRTDKRQQLRM